MVASVHVKIPPLAVGLDHKEVSTWLGRVVLKAKTVLQKEMPGSRGGRTYRRRGRYHVASAPGQFPAVDTGNLRARIETERRDWQAEIGTNVAYAKWLAPAAESGEGRGPKRLLFEASIERAIDETKAPADIVRWILGTR